MSDTTPTSSLPESDEPEVAAPVTDADAPTADLPDSVPAEVESPVESSPVDAAPVETSTAESAPVSATDAVGAEPPALVEPAEPAATGEVAPVEAAPVRVVPVAVEPVAPSVTEPIVPTSDPATAQTWATTPAPAQQQYVYVEQPVPFRKKGNRGLGILLVIVGTIIFGALYALVSALVIAGADPTGIFGTGFSGFIVSTVFFVPVAVFLVFFVLLVLLAHRASWWAYVIGSLIIGAITYFGSIGVLLLQEGVIGGTPALFAHEFALDATAPFIIAAGLIAREVSLWVGGAISARGRRVKAKNVEAKAAYDRDAAAKKAEYESANQLRYQP